jgi:hypothetical protein
VAKESLVEMPKTRGPQVSWVSLDAKERMVAWAQLALLVTEGS